MDRAGERICGDERGQAANVEADLRHRMRRFDEKSGRHLHVGFAVVAVL